MSAPLLLLIGLGLASSDPLGAGLAAVAGAMLIVLTLIRILG